MLCPLMSPIPAVAAFNNNNNIEVHGTPHLSKRINLNPLHWATSPLKKNWDKVGPVFNKYNDISRVISILLGAIGMVVMLEKHKWKPPRWPWAKDGLNHPDPSFMHENEQYTVDQLTEKKLMEMLKEMKMREGTDEPPIPEEIPSPIDEDEDVTLREAEKQFMDDAQEGVGEVIGEVKGVGVLG